MDDLAPFEIAEFVWCRDKRQFETLTTLAYQSGVFSQADLRKLPSLASMLRREAPDSSRSEYERNMQKWRDMGSMPEEKV